MTKTPENPAPLTRDQLRYLRKKNHRIVWLPYRKFRAWMETEGEPVYELRWPEKMRRPKRVAIFLRRLPKPKDGRDPGRLWPLGLGDQSPSPTGENSHVKQGKIPMLNMGKFPSPIGTEFNGTEEMEHVTGASLHGEDGGTALNVASDEAAPCDREVIQGPETASRPTDRATGQPATSEAERTEAILAAFEGLPEEERKRVEIEASKDVAPRLWHRGGAFRSAAIVAVMERDHSASCPPAPPEPDRSPWPSPPPRTATVAELAEAAIRSVAETRHPDQVEHAAQLLGSRLRDPGSVPSFRRTLMSVAEGRLAADAVLSAFRKAIGPGVRRPGAIFNYHLGNAIFGPARGA